MSNEEESSYTLAQYRSTFSQKYRNRMTRAIKNLLILGRDAAGTHFQWEDETGSLHFGVITNLFEVQTQQFGGSVLTTMPDQGAGTDLLVAFGANQNLVTLASGAAVIVQGSDVVAIDDSTGVPTPLQNGLIVRPIDAKGLSDSISIGGQATAPLATAVIATMTPGVAGVYEVYAHASIGLGVPAAGDEANMGLYVTATLKQKLPYTGNTGGPFGPYRLTLTSVNTLNIKALANGTAGVEYVAGITCRRVA